MLGVIGGTAKTSGKLPPKEGCLIEAQINQAEGQRVTWTEGPACEGRPKAKSTTCEMIK